MDLYIPTSTVATILGWSTSDFRAVRRTLKAPLVVQRGTRTGRGKTPDELALEPLCRWLNRVLPGGLDRATADELADAARPLT